MRRRGSDTGDVEAPSAAARAAATWSSGLIEVGVMGIAVTLVITFLFVMVGGLTYSFCLNVLPPKIPLCSGTCAAGQFPAYNTGGACWDCATLSDLVLLSNGAGQVSLATTTPLTMRGLMGFNPHGLYMDIFQNAARIFRRAGTGGLSFPVSASYQAVSIAVSGNYVRVPEELNTADETMIEGDLVLFFGFTPTTTFGVVIQFDMPPLLQFAGNSTLEPIVMNAMSCSCNDNTSGFAYAAQTNCYIVAPPQASPAYVRFTTSAGPAVAVGCFCGGRFFGPPANAYP